MLSVDPKRLPRNRPLTLAAALLQGASLLLTACDGGSGMQPSSNSETPQRGALLQTPPQLLSTVTTSALLAELNAPANQQVLALSGPPVCDFLMYHIEYETVGGAGEATTASAALLVPTGAGSACTGSRPIVEYAHGTSTERNFNMADMQNAETLLLAALFATQGYIVVAPNYAGYDTSTLPYHPFLIAEQQSNDMIDALTAARTALPLASLATVQDNGKLYLIGYSQGGYVAMATLRAMQAAGMQVNAAVPMSGPYALAAFADAEFYGEVNSNATVSTAFLVPAYQHAYGNIYASTADVFEAPYASSIGSLLPTTLLRSQLYTNGLLPQYALFSLTPPAAQYADITPPATPANLAPVFAQGFGAGNLVLNSYRLSYLQDAQAHPDGGFPMLTTGLPAAAPGLPLRQGLQTNDMRSFSPAVPTLLCGGDLDPEVFWLNTDLMQHYWASQAPSAPVTVLDLETTPSAGDPYASLERGFQVAKAAVAAQAIASGATDGGAAAVFADYHVMLVAPFCVAAAKTFIATH